MAGEHYEIILNHTPADTCPDLDTQSATATASSDIREDESTLDEAQKAIRMVKNGRATEPDGIQLELLKFKYAEEPVNRAPNELFHKAWTTGRVPIEWKEGVIVSLYKGKGTRNQCSSYRSISLLSVPWKASAHVLLIRLEPLLTKTRRTQQSGFTRGRSTMDAILALHLLSELLREFGRPLNAAHIDIKAAFDSVDRNALWKSLRRIGVSHFPEAHRGPPQWHHITCKTRRSSISEFPHNIRCLPV